MSPRGGEVAEQPPHLDEPLCVDFMNTVWAGRRGVHDSLSTPAGVVDWYNAGSRRGLVPADRIAALDHLDTPVETDLVRERERLVELRDALRAAATFQTGATRDISPDPRVDEPTALATLNAHAAAPWVPALELGPARRRWSTPLGPADALMSLIALDAIAVLSGDGGLRLRGCTAPRCVLFFTGGHPRRRWCSDSCGNRARVARHAARATEL